MGDHKGLLLGQKELKELLTQLLHLSNSFCAGLLIHTQGPQYNKEMTSFLPITHWIHRQNLKDKVLLSIQTLTISDFQECAIAQFLVNLSILA